MKNFFSIHNSWKSAKARKRRNAVLLLGLLSLGWLGSHGQTTIYVSATAAGANNGSSWGNAFVNLQDALNAANPGDAVWVKGGTYYPTEDINGLPSLGGRSGSFTFRKNLLLYGGFAGTETALGQRTCNPSNPTVLSGDVGILGNPVDNAIHVCYAQGLDTTFVMDCFTVRDGNATGVTTGNGGGWYNDGQAGACHPSFQNCIFINNMAGLGAGFYNDGSNGGAANPRFANCTFMHNNAEIGGGLYNNGYAGDASPQLGNCTFLQNDASEGGGLYSNGEVGQSNGSYTDCIFDRNEAIRGGGIFNHADNGTTRGTFLRCDIIDNSATQFGGGLASFTQVGDAKSTFTDCNILRNHANSGGGGVWNNGASPWFYNCLLQENTAKNGAAVYNEGSQGLKTGPRLVGCTIRQNTATERGGAMFNNAIAGETESQLIYCKFISNTAIWGGAIYADGSAGGDAEDLFYNCLFSRNQASVEGGAGYGVASGGQSIQAFASCSFSANTAPTGSLFYLTQFNTGLTNFRQYNLASHGHAGTIVSLNGGAMMEVEDGIYEAGTAATCSGNCLVGQNPMFANAAADDLTLQAVSPAIDAGNNVYYLPQYPLDLGGNVRIQGGTIDMGAYETVGLPPCPRVLFVNRIATGANDGTSWADAYLDLQAALAEARVNSCIDTILIAEGTYYPTSTTNRSISYELVNDIEIYGGFPSTGNPWFPQRDIILHETILSSDIGVQGVASDNSLAVISAGGVPPVNIFVNLNSGTIVDGLSIIPGSTGYWVRGVYNGTNCETVFRDIRFYGANSLAGGFGGGPITLLNYSQAQISHLAPTFERCQFYDNYNFLNGGAVNLFGYSNASTSECSPLFKACTFSRNEARRYGGAVQVFGQVTPTFEECIFENNEACMAPNNFGGGGALYFSNAMGTTSFVQHSRFNNCLFYQNRTDLQGGCYNAWSYGSTSTITVDFNNCTFSGHRSQLAGFGSSGVSGVETINFNNCIIWDNASTGNGRVMITNGNSAVNFRHTLIDVASCLDPGIRQYGSSVVNCITGMIYNQNPQFLNPAAGNYRLALTSPAINSGDNALIPPGVTTDLAGNPRIQAPTSVDMGCYENFPGMLRPAVYINTETPTVYAGFGAGTALLKSIVDGGTAPYSYAWSTGATTDNITVSPSQTTTYQLTVTDQLGMVLESEVTVQVVNVACQRPNQQPGVIVCNNAGNTVCLPLNAVNALISNGSATLGPCSGPLKQAETGEEQMAEPVVIYPNPVRDVLHLSYGDNPPTGGLLLDQLGRVVLEFDGPSEEIDLRGVASGIYILRLQLGTEVQSRRIVKE